MKENVDNFFLTLIILCIINIMKVSIHNIVNHNVHLFLKLNKSNKS